MPDPQKLTVSASQAPALFNQSPYQTRRTLFEHFAHGFDIDGDGGGRLDFGKFVEPFVLDQAAERLRLEVTRNHAAEYVRHPSIPIGCTRDASVWCPDRGKGVVEAKAVDYFRFRETWTESAAPIHIEIQLQAQMLSEGASWGVIACMVGNNDGLLLFERRPIERMWEDLERESRRFMEEVANDNPPSAFGHVDEVAALAHLYPAVVPAKRLELLGDRALAENVRLYKWAQESKAQAERLEKQFKPKLMDLMGDAEFLRVFGAEVKCSKSTSAPTILALPLETQAKLKRIFRTYDLSPEDKDALIEAFDWNIQTRAGSVRTSLTVKLIDDPEPETANPLGA